MSQKVKEAQDWIDGLEVARMQTEFINHFRDEYNYNVHLLAVGPLQSFLGLMIEKGYINFNGTK